MMKEKRLQCLLLLAVTFISGVQSLCSGNATVIDNEEAAHGVELKIYRITVSEFEDADVIDKFTTRISAEATTYCTSSPGACGLTFYDGSHPFKDFHVTTVTGPTASLKDVKVTFALDLPADIYLNSSESPDCVVKKLALQAIIGNARVSIHSDTGYWITYVDTQFFGIPPPTTLNKIIIPIACAVVLGIALLAIGMNVWNKRREAEERRRKIIEQRQKSKKLKETPVYNIPTDDLKAPGGLEGKKTETAFEKKSPISMARAPDQERNENLTLKTSSLMPTLVPDISSKDQLYKDNLRKSNMMARKIDTASEDSAIRVDNEPRHRQAYAYEKTPDGATGGSDLESKQYGHLAPIDPPVDEETKEKKKKKKKKRSKSKEAVDGVNNQGYQWTANSSQRTTVWDYQLE